MVLNPEEIDRIHAELQKALEKMAVRPPDDTVDVPVGTAAASGPAPEPASVAATAAKIAQPLSSARIAQALREAPRDSAMPFLMAIERLRAGRILGQLPADYAAELLQLADPEEAVAILSAVRPSDAVPILQLLPGDVSAQLLDQTEESFRSRVREVTAYPDRSAGARMRPEFVTITVDHTVGQTLRALRSAAPGTEQLSYVYVTAEDGRPLGVVSVRDLLRLSPDSALSRAMDPTLVAVHTDDDAAEAARLLRNRRLTTIPVLDAQDRIVGVISFDDAIDILSEDVASQMSGMSAVAAEESFFTPPFSAIRMRLPWMAANIFLNLGAVAVITGFEETIAAVAILAAFLPMITDMGGNVGIQSLSVAIRAIALGEVRLRDFWRAIRKEVTVGLVNGLALGALFMAVAFTWQRDAMIGAIAGVALATNVLVAGVVGGTIPFLIKRLGKDPAMMTGPILTTITDITGVTIYLGLSTVFLLA